MTEDSYDPPLWLWILFVILLALAFILMALLDPGHNGSGNLTVSQVELDDGEAIFLVVAMVAMTLFMIYLLAASYERVRVECPACGEFLSYKAKDDVYYCLHCDEYYEMTLLLIEDLDLQREVRS